MYDLTVIDQFMETVIDQDRYTSALLTTQFAMVFVESCIPFVLKALDCRSRGSAFVYLPLMMEATSAGGSNAVTEKILWSWGFQDSPVIVFGSIDMDMMFIHDKCFWNDVQAFINFRRSSL